MESTLDLRDFLRLVSRRKWLVAVFMALFAGLLLLRADRMPPTYEASSKVLIGPDTLSNRDVRGSDLSFLFLGSRDYVASFAEQLQGRPLAEQVVESLGVDILPTALAGNVSTSIVPDTRIIAISYRDRDPVRAALVANGIVDTFAASQKRQGTVEGLQATPFEAALVPSTPVAPNPVRDGILGWFLGGFLGVAAAVGLEQMDTRLRNREELELAVSPAKVLAEVPGPRGGDSRQLWLEAEPGSAAAEAFRILRTNLQFLAVERRIHTLLVTSPSPQEGKTTIAANLAASMAAGGYRTLLVDADMRHPTVQLYFGLDHTHGLSEVLAGTLDLAAAIRETSFRNLSVMTAGPQPPNPSELFGSQRMQALVETLEHEFDFVVFDAPPTLLVADAPALSSNLDGVIFVARSGSTTREQVREALRRFTLLDARILGAVLNASKRIRIERYYGYRNYYAYDPAGGELSRREHEVQPAMGRSGRREERGPRSIDSILQDLETIAARRRHDRDPGAKQTAIDTDLPAPTNGSATNGAQRPPDGPASPPGPASPDTPASELVVGPEESP